MAAISPDRTRGTLYMRQRVVCLVAAAAFLVAAAAPGALALGAVGIVLALLAIPQWRGRAPISWLGAALRYLSRSRHSYGAGRFALVAPDASVMPVDVSGTPVGAIADANGLAAIIEIGEPDALLASGGVTIPWPADLSGSPTPDEPTAVTQVLLVRRAHFQRLFVAVRVGGDGIGWTDAQLRQALSGAVRGVVRRLARSGVTGRPLSPTAAPAAVAWAVDGGRDPATSEIAEAWDHLRIGTDLQVTIRIGVPADRVSSDLIARLLSGPATVSALAIAEHRLLLRVAAPSTGALARAVAAAMVICPGTVSHLDGEQRGNLTATLPLGLADVATPARLALAARPRRSRSAGQFALPTRPTTAGGPRHPGAPLVLPEAGLLLGRDRRGVPIYLQLDPTRTTPLRLAVVGGPVAARVLSSRLRALTEGIPAAAAVAMAVFEHLTPADSATLASADLVVCQPVPQPEAALVASALRLMRAGAWLSRIEGDMIAIISDGAVRWAQLSAHNGESRRPPSVTGLTGVART
jgi:hypothetical protein